uniref:G patch domain and KOW motifs-containing protein n=1 Tax=Schistocephalus solidus TaxID=70667 RepID=A0A0X3PNF5_SCHSO
MSSDPPKFSFGFSKTKKHPKLVKCPAVVEEEKKEAVQLDYLSSFEDRTAHSLVKTVVEELSIPLRPSRSNLRIRLEKKYVKVEPDDELTATAIRELTKGDLLEAIPGADSCPVVGLPEKRDGLEAEEEEVDEADYSTVPIEKFGMALLKGMGFNTENPGPTLEDFSSKVRLKGLGLGADPAVLMKARQTERAKAGDDEKLEWKSGACCQVIWGKYDGQYGTVEGIDGDTGRVVVKLSVTKEIQRIMQAALRLVTRKEYDKFSNYLNQAAAAKYKDAELEASQPLHNGDRMANSDGDPSAPRKRARMNEERQEDSHLPRHDHPSHSQRTENGSSNWARKGLLVRYLDKHSHNGKYYMQKVTVLSVSPSSDRCSCETESGRHLKDVKIRDIQTVVPRHRGERTMIIRGQYAEEMGKLVDRIDKTATARIVLLSSGKEIVVPFDDVCMLAT